MPFKAYDLRGNERWLLGLSTDVKPTLPLTDATTRLMEIDTGSTHMWTGIQWVSSGSKGAMNIHNKHVHTRPVSSFFHRHVGAVETLTVASVKNDTQITVSNAAAWVVDDRLDITNAGDSEPTEPEIVDIASNVVTLDRPLNFAWPVGTQVQKIDENMNAVTVPTSFRVTIPNDESWHVETIILNMIMGSAGDDTTFGDLTRLTNGLLIRAYDGELDQYYTLANWKSNGEIAFNMVTQYNDKAGGGKFGFNGQGNILGRTGAVIQLRGWEGDFMEIATQDDLSGLDGFRIKLLGHLEE